MTIACQPRGLDGKDSAYLSLADGGQQILEAAPRDVAAARTALVLINHADILEAQLPGVLLQAVLPALALHIVLYLRHGGLADIDVGGTLKMAFFDLAHG